MILSPLASAVPTANEVARIEALCRSLNQRIVILAATRCVASAGQQGSSPSTRTPPDRGGREQHVEPHRPEAPDIDTDVELPRQ